MDIFILSLSLCIFPSNDARRKHKPLRESKREREMRGGGHNLSALSFDNAHLSRVVARKMLNANIGNEDSLFFFYVFLSLSLFPNVPHQFCLCLNSMKEAFLKA